MPATTPVHGIPYPLGSEPPLAPAQLQALATVIDGKIPVVSTAAPPHAFGLIWRNPDTGVTSISDGSAWQPVSIRGERATVTGVVAGFVPRVFTPLPMPPSGQGNWTVAAANTLNAVRTGLYSYVSASSFSEGTQVIHGGRAVVNGVIFGSGTSYPEGGGTVRLGMSLSVRLTPGDTLQVLGFNTAIAGQPTINWTSSATVSFMPDV